MLSEEEKAHIIERLQFENTMKKELSPPEERKRYGWIESKIGLLLIGSMITGILVPTFQYTQKVWEWRRQNQFANLSFKLGVMRDCLREFNYLSALAAEAYERIKPLLKETKLSEKEFKDLEHQYVDLQNRRFTQNAKVVSLMVHFRDTHDFQKLFEQEYSNAFNLYMQDVGAIISLKGCAFGLTRCTGANKDVEAPLDAKKEELLTRFAELKVVYQKVVAKMKEEIGRAEDEGAKFGL